MPSYALIRRRINRDRSRLLHQLLMILDAKHPPSSLAHILLDEDVLAVPLSRNSSRDSVLRLTHLVRNVEQPLGVEVPLHQVGDLSAGKVCRRAEVLHLLHPLVVDLSRLNPQITEDFVLDLGREVAKERRVNIEVFGPKLLNEFAEFFLRRDTRVGRLRARLEAPGDGGEGVIVSEDVLPSCFGNGADRVGRFEVFEVDGVVGVDDVARVELVRRGSFDGLLLPTRSSTVSSDQYEREGREREERTNRLSSFSAATCLS